MRRKYRVQGAWLFVVAFLGGNVYVWSKIPSDLFSSVAYWTSYAIWAIIGGWGLLPKRLGVKDQTSRLNPLWVGIPALLLFVLSRSFAIVMPLFLSFFGVFAGMAIRMGYYLILVLASNGASKGPGPGVPTESVSSEL